MSVGLVGEKRGTTKFFDENGRSSVITLVEFSGPVVTALKNTEKHGYNAVQLGFEIVKSNKINKPHKGLFAKIKTEPRRYLREFRISDQELANFEIGKAVDLNIFTVDQKIDVTGISKGKGCAGVQKRHNFKSNRASHGNSRSTNKAGSIGQCQFPGRVFPGKKMAGQMGNEQVTVQNLKIFKIDPENNIIAVRGSIPGAIGGLVMLKPSVKQKKQRGG